MTARGPDAAGAHSNGKVAFGHRRLKIIDLTEHGRQPMTDPELDITLVFNGCIYNHKELRQELEANGYRFFSTSDTEVVLKSVHCWGQDAPKHFNGMFAFAAYDHRRERLILGRDRMGIKPLYIDYVPGKHIRFASTLPALIAAGNVDTSIDPIALHHFMTFHAVVPAPFTMIKGVRKLPPATVSVIDEDGNRTDHVYWAPLFERAAHEENEPTEYWREKLLDALRKAVLRRTVADVPVGVLLSGGVDSSLIVGLLAEQRHSDLKTFSIGFDNAGGEDGNEFVYSDLIAEHFATEHYKIIVSADRLLDSLPKTFKAMSEPMVSYDNVGFFLLSEEVSQHVKVVQSGQGADEIFGGYHWYPPLMDSTDPVTDYAKVFFDRQQEEFEAAVHPQHHGDDHSLAFVREQFALPGAGHPVDKALRIDSTVMLVDDPVKRVDNMTMAFGLEARVPFLDHELVELAARIPPAEKLRNDGKGILKDAARKVIPHEVIDRTKGYFPVPALKYLEGPYLDYVQDALTSQKAKERELFQTDYLNELFEAPQDHLTPLRGSKLWQVAVLELWLQAQGL